MARAGSASSSWVLPTVDRDVVDFRQGSGTGYAWVQSSATMYLFAPVPERSEDGLKVVLDLANEGSHLHLQVCGTDVINGKLAHAIKPGTEIWMVEEAADGKEFVVVELDKNIPGREWSSVMLPEVSFVGDYSKLQVVSKQVTEEEKSATVTATLEHLQQKFANAIIKADGYQAQNGDTLMVDMQGYEQAADGTRGKELGIASATNMKVNLGTPGGGLNAQMHEALVGITMGETRDLEATLGRRAGELGGQRILLAVTCRSISETALPELDDNFARAVKRNEQFMQAGTEQGIPEHEEDTAAQFTIDALRAEIAEEVQKGAETEALNSIKSQLQAALMRSARVSCEWASVDDAVVRGEELAAVTSAVVDREHLSQFIDMEQVKKDSWDELAVPSADTGVAEVGRDPDRDFQREFQKIHRKAQMEQVLSWLEERAEKVAELEDAQ